MASIPEVPDYWPEVADDLSKVNWSHATNSKALLQDALGDPSILMIEADIQMGHLIGGDNASALIPIMAHPPVTLSDLSFQMFLDSVLQAVSTGDVKKGIKLDFKMLDAVEPCLNILLDQEEKLTIPVWLNADILPGPVQATATPLDPDTFIPTCTSLLPEATLSIGWTTQYTNATDPAARYSVEDVTQMAGLLDKYGIDDLVTFPVRAAFVGKSLDTLEWLMNKFYGCTLTVWSSESDDVDIMSLVILRDLVGADRVYYDLPPDQQSEFEGLIGSARSNAIPTVQLWPKHTLFWVNCVGFAIGLAVAFNYLGDS